MAMGSNEELHIVLTPKISPKYVYTSVCIFFVYEFALMYYYSIAIISLLMCIWAFGIPHIHKLNETRQQYVEGNEIADNTMIGCICVDEHAIFTLIQFSLRTTRNGRE